jgi:vacuolar protein sorting-associated protein 13A/C
MFEGLAEQLLKSILGEYVDNLDSQNLSISVWSGHVSLRDLRLKPNLLQKFNLPFDLKLGIIKNMNLEFPWARLSSSPVVCKLDQLYLVVSPQKESDWVMRDVVSFKYKQEKLNEYVQRYTAQAALDLAQSMSAEAE